MPSTFSSTNNFAHIQTLYRMSSLCRSYECMNIARANNGVLTGWKKIKQRRISFVLDYLRMILWKISTAISIKHRILATINTGVNKSPSPTPGASNFHIWASWNNQLYARRASKNIYWILTNLSIFAYLLIFIYVICCLISSNVLFIQPLAFCRNWEQRR